jgi:hypothetical protein
MPSGWARRSDSETGALKRVYRELDGELKGPFSWREARTKFFVQPYGGEGDVALGYARRVDGIASSAMPPTNARTPSRGDKGIVLRS